jgi:hypothetical protein
MTKPKEQAIPSDLDRPDEVFELASSAVCATAKKM